VLGNESFDGHRRATGTEDVNEVLQQFEVGHGFTSILQKYQSSTR
jgi:hypothetical protein